MPQIALQCPYCQVIATLEDEESELLRLGASVLIDCNVCGRSVVGESAKVWKFYSAGEETAITQPQRRE
jgi:uncharacterized Zn finger protein